MAHSGSFNTSSKLLAKKWEEKKYHSHVEKMRSAKSSLDNAPPKQYPHMVLRLKKIRQEEEKQAEIDHNNQLLLQRMTRIMRSKGRVDNWNDYESRSMNQLIREKEQERIAERNYEIARRLDGVKPIYHVQDWEGEWLKHAYYLDMWSHTTKDYQIVSPRGAGTSKHDKAEYEDDFEDDHDDNRRKLPAIESRETSKVSQKTETKKGSTNTKLPKITGQKNDTDKEEESIAENDSKLLFKASKQMAKGDETILKTLIKRSHAQRMANKNRFEDMYGLVLADELKGALSEAYGPLIDCLLTERQDTDAETVSKAIHDNSISALVELVCSRNPSAMASINKAYKERFDVSIEDDIGSRILDEDCQSLLIALLGTNRQSGDVDEKLADSDAHDLYEAKSGRFTDDNGTFMRLLNERSMPQIKATFTNYQILSGGDDLTEAMKKDGCSKDYVAAMKTMTKCMNNSTAHFAEKINAVLQTGDTRELVNLILARSEMDMPDVRKVYKKKYGSELIDDIIKKNDREVGPLIAQIAAKVPPGKGAPGKPGAKKGVNVPTPPKKPLSKRPDQTNKKEPSKNNPLTVKTKKPYLTQQTQKGKAKGGTVHPTRSFNVDSDVKKIHDAMDGFGTDEKPLIEILANRDNAQRQQIRKEYQETYKKPLIDVLESELRGDFEELILALMMTPTEYDAYCLHDSMDGLGTREAALIGILCTRNAKELKAINSQYKKNYDQNLIDDLKDDTSGDFSELLVQLSTAARDQSESINQKQAEEDAKQLFQDGKKAIDVNEGTFKDILSKRNKNQLKATFEQYKKIAGQSLHEGIKNAMIGDTEDGYLALVEACQDPVSFYAKRLQDSMSGVGTNDKQLIRIIVSRSEVDLDDIKVKYKQLVGKTLGESIENECSGDYKKLLLAIVNNNEEVNSQPASRLSDNSPKDPQDKTNSQIYSANTDNGSNNNESSRPKPKAEKRQFKTAPDNYAAKKSNVHEKKSGKGIIASDKKGEENSTSLDRTPKTEKTMHHEESPREEGQDKLNSKDGRVAEKSSDDGNEQTNERKTVCIPKETHGSIIPVPNFDSNADARAIKKAIEGWNNDETTLINLLSTRSNVQRQEIKGRYHDIYGKELLTDLKDALSGDFEEMIVALLMPPFEYDAMCLKDAMDGMGTNEDLINGILISRTAKERSIIKRKYQEAYNKELIIDLKNETSGDYEDIVCILLDLERDQSYLVDYGEAEMDAKKLHNDGNYLLKPTDTVFLDVLTKRNKQQIKETLAMYEKISGADIENDIKRCTVGDSENALIALVKYLKDHIQFYAEKLHSAMVGIGTDDSLLIRLIVSRSEIDLMDIGDKYKELFGLSLADAIESECSGDYKKLLLAVLGYK